MDHEIPLITTIAAAFGLALLFGLGAERLKVPALVGFLLAGMMLGSSASGAVADVALAQELAEIGVMLLMFGVGLHFSIDDLIAVKRIALPGAIVQMALATVLGMMIAVWWWGWQWGSGFVFGLSLSCASTVVLLKAMEVRGLLETMNGRIAVGWLVVEDLVTVMMLVLLPSLAGVLGAETEEAASNSLFVTILGTFLQVAAFIALMMLVGRRVLPVLLWQVANTGSRELFTLAVLTCAIGIAYGASALFNVSFALGAFFAGMVMRESEFSHRAARESLPLRDAFSVLFFVSVGMLFEPSIVFSEPWKLLATVGIIMFGKSMGALTLVLAMRYPLNTALVVAASLAQIGEFSFILAGLGLSLGVLPSDGMSLVLAGSLISIALNPLLFLAIAPVRRWVLARSALAQRLEQRADPYAELPSGTPRRFLEGQVIVIGYGRVGKRIARELDEASIPYLIVEENREVVEGLRQRGIPAVTGNAAEAAVLIQAHVAQAAMLVVATPDPLPLRDIADTARLLNPKLEIVLRTHGEAESHMLEHDGIGKVFFGEAELAKGMARHVIERFTPRVEEPEVITSQP